MSSSRLWKPATILLALCISLLVILLEIATKYLLNRLPGNSRYLVSEFPHINRDRFKEYSSFDPTLGWVRQPHESREQDVAGRHPDNEPDTNPVSLSTDRYGSRLCEIDRGTADFTVATYGDSYCFCWEVSDDETFQHYLSQELGVHVSNYGVGNYGLDQSLLRLKRQFEDDPADYVVVALCDKTAIERIVSVWLHYFQFDNPLAVKPRFRIEGGELRTVPVPITEKAELLTLEKHRTYLRTNDYHYDNYFRDWFESHQFTVPYTRYWFRNRYNFAHAVSVVVNHAVQNRSWMTSLQDRTESVSTHITRKKRERDTEQYAVSPEVKSAYREHLTDCFLELFCAELREFSRFVRSRGAVPVFFPLQHKDAFYYEFDPLAESEMNCIRKECPHLHVVDPREEIATEIDDVERLYVRKGSPGGHLSSMGNERYAEHLAQFICNHRETNSTSENSDTHASDISRE